MKETDGGWEGTKKVRNCPKEASERFQRGMGKGHKNDRKGSI
jgi:hypothetical protein